MIQDSNNNQPQPVAWNRRKLALRILIYGSLILAIVGGVTLSSNWFQEKLRRRVVAALEQAIGGRVEVGRFSFTPTTLMIRMDGLVIFGAEKSGEQPLFTAEFVEAEWNLISVWGLRADLQRLYISQPHMNVVYREDGSSNLPLLKMNQPKRDSNNWTENIFSLKVKSFSIERGEVRVQSTIGSGIGERKIPLDLRAEGVRLGMNYDSGRERYTGELNLQKGMLRGIGPNAAAKNMQLPYSGNVKFALYRDKAEIESLIWKTDRSRISAVGSMTNFANPRIAFRYDTFIDWRDAATVVGSVGWQGDIAARGQGSFDEKGWIVDAPLTAHAKRMAIAPFENVEWSGSASLRFIAPSRDSNKDKSSNWIASITGIDLAMLEGKIQGTGRFEGEFNNGPNRGKVASQSNLQLEADHISLPVISGIVRSLGVSLGETHWGGTISGPVEIGFVGAGEQLTLKTDWRVEPSSVIPPGYVPVSGLIRATYRVEGDHVDFQPSNLQIGSTSVSAEGFIDREKANLAVRANAAHYDDLLPLANIVSKRASDIPIKISGPLNATLSWTGSVQSPNITGKVDLADVEYRGLRWERLSGEFEYKIQNATAVTQAVTQSGEIKLSGGQLLRGNSRTNFRGTVQLRNGEFTSASLLSINATLRDFRVEDIQALAQTAIPLKGNLSGTFDIQGSLDAPRGSGNVVINGGEAFQEPFTSIAAQIDLDSAGMLNAHHIYLKKDSGTIEGDASLSLKGRRYRIALTGAQLNLARFALLKRSGANLEGIAKIALSGEGELDHPTLDGRIEVEHLNAANIKDATLSAVIKARNDKATVQWNANSFGGEFQGTGEVGLKAPYVFAARGNYRQIDLGLLSKSVPNSPLPIDGVATGTVTATGNFKDEKSIHGNGEIANLLVRSGAYEFHNAEPVRILYSDAALEIARAHLVGENTDVEATGLIGLTRTSPVKLAVKGKLNLAAVSAVDPELMLTGQANLDANLSGSVENPLWRGRLEFVDANLRYGSLPNGLNKLTGAIVFQGARAGLENVTAESGGGTIKLGGLITYAKSTGLRLQVEADIHGVRVRYPEGISTWVDGRMTMTGSQQSSTLAGRLVITKQTASREFDIGRVFSSRSNQPLASSKAGPIGNLRLDVQIVSSPDVILETSTARNPKGEVDPRMQVSLDRPSWLGRVSILEGEVTIGGRTYVADRGELTFSNPFRIEPSLSLQVRARVEQYEISLNFSGSVDHLQVTYSSDPPLPTNEILPLLVAGSSYTSNLQTSPSNTVPELGPGAVLSQALNQQMGSRLDRIFGSGRIRVDPQIAGFNRPANANVAIEQHIANNLKLLYVTNVTSVQQQIIQAELTLSPRFSVTAIRDQNGLVGVNFQIKLRFR